MKHPTRRAAIVGLGAAAALPPLFGQAANFWLRRSVSDPQAARDIATLRAIWPTLVRDGWLERLTAFHAGQTRIAHGGWFFLPWHRMFLLKFETIVRYLSGNLSFALPYWDLYTTPQLPTLFWTQPFIDGTTVYRFSRMDTDFLGWRNATPRPRVSGLPFLAAHGDPMRAGAIEAGFHNWLHGALGGRNGANFAPMAAVPRSPVDIGFWLHHANVDRIWDGWMRQDDARRHNPTRPIHVEPLAPAEWINARLSLPQLSTVGSALGAYAVQSVLDPTAAAADGVSLAYDYAQPFSLDAHPSPPPPRTAPSVAFTSGGVITGSVESAPGPVALPPTGAVSIPFRVAAETMNGLLSRDRLTGSPFASASVVLTLSGDRLHETDINVALLVEGDIDPHDVITLSTAFHDPQASGDAGGHANGHRSVRFALDPAIAAVEPQLDTNGSFALQFAGRPSPLAAGEAPAVHIEAVEISYAIEKFNFNDR